MMRACVLFLVVPQVVMALAHVHAAGIIHRE